MSMETKKTVKVEINVGDYTATIEGGILDEWESKWQITFQGNQKIYGNYAIHKSFTRTDFLCDVEDVTNALWEEIDWFTKKYASVNVEETEIQVEVEDELEEV